MVEYAEGQSSNKIKPFSVDMHQPMSISKLHWSLSVLSQQKLQGSFAFKRWLATSPQTSTLSRALLWYPLYQITKENILYRKSLFPECFIW